MADFTIENALAVAPASQAKTALDTDLDSLYAEIATAAAGIQAVQKVTITGTPTGGTFTLSVGEDETGAIDYDASASEVQAALEALDSVGSGGVVCTGGALPGAAVTCTFAVSLGNVTTMTTDDALLSGGTNPAATVSSETTGELPAFSGEVEEQLQSMVVDLAETIGANLRGHTTA